MAEIDNTQSFKGRTTVFDGSNENYNAWLGDKATTLNFTDWLNEKNAGRTNNVDTTLVNASDANNEFGLLSTDTASPYQDWENFYKIFGSSAAQEAPIESAAPSLAASASAPVTLLSGQNTFPDLKIDPRNDAPALSAPAELTVPTSVMGMFPEVEAMQRALYQQKQNEAMQAQAMQFARLDPFEKASYGLAMGGQQLGGAIGGALGAKDPQMQMIGLQSRILSELIPGNPAQNIQIAQKYARFAPELAMKINNDALDQLVKMKQASSTARQGTTEKLQILDRLNEVNDALQTISPDAPKYKTLLNNKSLLESQLNKAEATPNEIQIATKLALQKGAEGTEAFKTEFNSQLLRLTTKETNPPAKEEIFDLVDKIKTLDPVKDKFEYDTYKARIEKLNKGKSLEETIGESFGMLGKALIAAQKKEGEETGKYTAENFKNLGSSVAAGTASKRNLATLENALDNAFTGKFAEGKEAVVGALISLGIPVGSDLKNATSNTQLIQAMGTRYIFPLVKNYPGSLAAKELASLEKTAPNALQQPETIKRLVNLLKVDLAENEYTYNKAKDYKKSNKESLIGFNEADSRIEFQNKLGRLQELVTNVKRKNSKTAEEDAQINQLKKELYIGG